MEDIIIDINSDLGESPEALASGADFELMLYHIRECCLRRPRRRREHDAANG